MKNEPTLKKSLHQSLEDLETPRAPHQRAIDGLHQESPGVQAIDKPSSDTVSLNVAIPASLGKLREKNNTHPREASPLSETVQGLSDSNKFNPLFRLIHFLARLLKQLEKSLLTRLYRWKSQSDGGKTVATTMTDDKNEASERSEARLKSSLRRRRTVKR